MEVKRINKQEFIDDYTKIGVPEMVKKYGLSRHTIYKHLKAFGITKDRKKVVFE